MSFQVLLSIVMMCACSILARADEESAPPLAPATPTAQSAAEPAEPFSEGDFSWAPANYAPTEGILATKYFTPEIRFDESYHYSFAHPSDDTISGSSEVFRANEFQTSMIGLGGDFKYKNVGFRFMTQFGMYAETTPRNDASPSRGQWNLGDAYRYISEAYASYHLDALHGINIQTGIFMSYIGLWSYYNFDNWTYQPSYVSSNTPWFFNGARVQIFTSKTLKIEPWLVNGWQSYGRFNHAPGLGLQTQWRPDPSFQMIGNQYFGADTLGIPGRRRMRTDDSVMYKYYENQKHLISKAAASFTFDAGCESDGGVNCGHQFFMGAMAYNRLWFDNDIFGFTVKDVGTGAEGLQSAADFHPHLVILDLGLPDMHGHDVLKEMRAWTTIPILVLTVQDDEVSKVRLLDAGADDYLTKPFGVPELLAPVRVALRHNGRQEATPIFVSNDLSIDVNQKLVQLDGKAVKLTATEFELLSRLARERGKVVPQQKLLKEIWGAHAGDQSHYLRIYINQLRKKLEKNSVEPQHILTEPGVG